MSVPGMLIYNYDNINQLLELIECFPEMENFDLLYVYHENPKKVFDRLFSSLSVIEAGGGIVRNDKGQILLIKRKNKWDLPKGKAEKGETAEQTAVREVKEECHIDELMIKDFFDISYHLYKIKEKMVLKRTHWYDMLYCGNGNLRPQEEEDITEVRWFDKNVIKQDVFNNTYVLIKELLTRIIHE